MMNWYVLQLLQEGADIASLLPRRSYFVIRSCASYWRTNPFILSELEARRYLNCVLIQCTDEELQALIREHENVFRRRQLNNDQGPYGTLTLTEEQVNQLLLLLHVTENYRVIRCLMPAQTPAKLIPQEILRGPLRGLRGTTTDDRANQRKFMPCGSLPGLRLLLLIPAAELRPLTKVEYERLRLTTDTRARWYMVLCKNERTLRMAFRHTVSTRKQEGVLTQELDLEEFLPGSMPYPQGISQRRYYYHVGKPYPQHYYFVYTTWGDIQGCRSRNAHYPTGLVWNRRYEPVALNERDFLQLVGSAQGTPVELSAHMQAFLESLKQGDRLGILLTNLQEVPVSGTLLRKKKGKVVVQGDDGVTYTVKNEKVKEIEGKKGK